MNDEKAKAFLSFARSVAEEESVWADWHNRVFGADGKFAELFPTEAEREEFAESRYYAQVERISEALKDGSNIREYTVPVTTSASGKFSPLPR